VSIMFRPVRDRIGLCHPEPARSSRKKTGKRSAVDIRFAREKMHGKPGGTSCSGRPLAAAVRHYFTIWISGALRGFTVSDIGLLGVERKIGEVDVHQPPEIAIDQADDIPSP